MALLSNLAMLVCLPADHQTFLDRVSKSDYLKKYSLNAEAFWEDEYRSQVAEPVQRLVERARTFGAHIEPRATLQSLHDATTKKKIVVLLTHWKGSAVSADDIVCENKATFLARLDSAPGSAPRYLARLLSESATERGIQEFVESAIPELEDSNPDGFIVSSDPITVRSERRDLVDKWFEGLLRPGNLLEFWDGLYARDDVARQVDCGFKGILDVAACNSSILADYLNRVTRSRFRVVQFPDVLPPALSCEALHLTFELMDERGLPYLTARMRALRYVADTLNAIVQVPKSGLIQRVWRSLWQA
jgi:hypothetical protein